MVQTSVSHESIDLFLRALAGGAATHHIRQHFHGFCAIAIAETFECLQNMIDSRHFVAVVYRRNRATAGDWGGMQTLRCWVEEVASDRNRISKNLVTKKARALSTNHLSPSDQRTKVISWDLID